MEGNYRRSLLDALFEYCNEGYKVCLVFLLFEADRALKELLNIQHEDELIEPLQNWADRQNDIDDEEFECRLREAFEMCKVCNDVRKNKCQKYFEVPERFWSILEKSRFVHPMKKLLLYTCKADKDADRFVSKVHDKYCSSDAVLNSSIAEVIILDLILRNEFHLGTWNASKKYEEACNLAFVDENFQTNEFVNIFDKIHSLQNIINGRLSRFPIYYEQDVGICLIINNENFENQSQREGTEHDEISLKMCWNKYGFNVKIHNDLEANEIIACLKYYIKQMKKKDSVFMFCILSHGTSDSIYGSDDETVKISDIIDVLLTSEQLYNKPKILILQACRGIKRVDMDEKIYSDQALNLKEIEFQSNSQTIDKRKDILILYPTLEEYVALRSADRGTLYVSKLCEVFEKSVTLLDQIEFQRTLLKVHHEVSQVQNCIQVCSFEDHFTKKLVLKKIES